MLRAPSAPLDYTSVRTAITEYHRLGNLDNTHLFLADLETGSLRLHWQIPRLGRILFLIFRWLSSHSLYTTGQRETESSDLHPLTTDLNIGLHLHDLTQTQLPPKGPTPKATQSGLWILEGHTYSAHEWAHNLFFSLTPGSILWVLALLSELSFLCH